MHDSLGLYIGGEWRFSNRNLQPVLNPATEAELGQLPLANTTDLDDALNAAEEAWPAWRGKPAVERGAILKRAAAILRDKAQSLAKVIVLEQGKPITEATTEVMVAAEVLDWCAEEGRRQYGRIIPARTSGSTQMVLMEPLGVSLLLTPWNFPMAFPARKIGEALAAGCTCIIKPAEEVPASAVAVVRALEEAGAPPGVVNLVFGVPAEVSSYLLASPVVQKVSFTGSVPVGKLLAEQAARSMINTTMELGGHAPTLVFDDVDIDAVTSTLILGKFRNAGQVCNAPTRFLVQDAIYDKFVTEFARKGAALKVGSGLEATTQMGPLTHGRRLRALEETSENAASRGGRIVAGGKKIGDKGYFFAPTVVDEPSADSLLMTEEPFGPIAAISRFQDMDEVISRANSLPYGLAAFVFTNDMRRSKISVEGLRAGVVGVNTTQVALPETPFGGVKESGHGIEGGSEGVAGYMSKKFVSQAI